MQPSSSDKNLNLLSGQLVVVTGGAGLLGRQIAKSIMKCGGVPVIADIDYEQARRVSRELGQELNTESIPVQMDITSEESVTGVISSIDTQYGTISALINNAYPRNKNYGNKLFDVTYDDFCENISLNIGGFFLVTQKFTEYFCKKDFGNIISLASIYGVVAPRFEVYEDTNMTMPVEYAAIKSAVIHLNQYFMKYTKGRNIRYNCISPGGVRDGQPEQFINKYNDFSHGKGMLEPKDVARTAIFLLSEYSEFINGQNIIIDDGWVL